MNNHLLRKKSIQNLIENLQQLAKQKLREKIAQDYWHKIYDWIQKSVGFRQFGEEKTI
jgi:type 1 glutamine amidotransferase